MVHYDYKKLMYNLIPVMAGSGCFDSDYKAVEALKSIYVMLKMIDGEDCINLQAFIQLFCDSFNCRYNVPEEMKLKTDPLFDAVSQFPGANITLGGDLIEYAADGME